MARGGGGKRTNPSRRITNAHHSIIVRTLVFIALVHWKIQPCNKHVHIYMEAADACVAFPLQGLRDCTRSLLLVQVVASSLPIAHSYVQLCQPVGVGQQADTTHRISLRCYSRPGQADTTHRIGFWLQVLFKARTQYLPNEHGWVFGGASHGSAHSKSSLAPFGHITVHWVVVPPL